MEIMFDKEAALLADRGGIIDESGYYEGVITKADVEDGSPPTKPTTVTIGIETDDGKRSDYIKLYTKKKDGERNKRDYGMMMALLALAKIERVSVVSDGDRKAIPALIGKRIAVGLQKEWYTKNDGSDGWSLRVTHFFHPTTHQTYSEMAEGKEAKAWGKELKDKFPSNKQGNSQATTPMNVGNDLPF